MKTLIENYCGSERSVELDFIKEMVKKYRFIKEGTILDVGGIPTNSNIMHGYYEAMQETGMQYKVADFRGGDYPGDFVTNPIKDKFEIIIFLSSLEHFPQCTEGDMQFREGEDRKGFEKAISLLSDDGIILLTVPFGKPVWQDYHQNYDMDLINKLSEGTEIIEQYVYRLVDGNWVEYNPKHMDDVLYTDQCYGVGCFVFRKN